jgi:hypothetical protein
MTFLLFCKLVKEKIVYAFLGSSKIAHMPKTTSTNDGCGVGVAQFHLMHVVEHIKLIFN